MVLIMVQMQQQMIAKKRLDLEQAIDKKVSGFTFMKDLAEGIPGLRVFSLA